MSKGVHNMKKTLINICIFMTAVLLCGCNISDEKSGKIEIHRKLGTALDFSICIDEVSASGAVLHYDNNVEDIVEVMSGGVNDHYIDQYIAGKWYPVELVKDNIVFSVLYPCRNGISQAINWEYYYGELSKGHYRIAKEFFTRTPNDKSLESFWLVAEFDVR